jgi:hypothetical protein
LKVLVLGIKEENNMIKNRCLSRCENGTYFGSKMSKTRKHLSTVILVISFAMVMLAPALNTHGAPVILNEAAGGSWSDSFSDGSGIVQWLNTTIENGNVMTWEGIDILDNFDDEPLGSTPSTWYLTSPIAISEVIDSDNFSAPNCYYTKEVSATTSELACRDFINPGYDVITFEFDFIPVNTYTQLQAWSGSTTVSRFDGGFGGPSDLRYKDTVGWHDTGYDVDPNSWNHYKIVYETTQGKLDFYVNGIQFVDDGGLLNTGYMIDSFRLWYNIDRTYEFKIDNLRIYGGKLSTYGEITSVDISLPQGQTWDSLILDKTEYGPEGTINITVLDAVTSQPISGYEDLPGINIDISSIDPILYPVIKLQAKFSGNGTVSPLLHEWKATWIDNTPPDIPKGLTVTNPFTGQSLIISWYSNTESDLSQYVLHYSVDGMTFQWLSNISFDVLSFTHYGLSVGTTYFYKIAAADSVPNQSPFSDVVDEFPDLDMDGDGVGNIPDTDDDGDGVLDTEDEFPLNVNEWLDTDYDGIGNNADIDDDGDDYNDVVDAFPLNSSEWHDTDLDGIGNNLDYDDDNDGYSDLMEIAENSDPQNQGSIPPDNDGDFSPDSEDDDDDNDGVLDISDDLPFNPNEVSDSDGDGMGDNVDNDDDGDGVWDVNDAFPYDAGNTTDTDRDGLDDAYDLDDDNDGYNDTVELKEGSDPLNPGSIPKDNDNDFNPDSTDTDDDNDGVLDISDDLPFNPNEVIDSDGDGIGDNVDNDDDGDGVWDVNDAFPYDAGNTTDMDRDGLDDAYDIDDDNDGVSDSMDDFPLNPYEVIDTDSDGIGDNSDSDDDEDGVPDVRDAYPYDPSRWEEAEEDDPILMLIIIMLILTVIILIISFVNSISGRRDSNEEKISFEDVPPPSSVDTQETYEKEPSQMSLPPPPPPIENEAYDNDSAEHEINEEEAEK